MTEEKYKRELIHSPHLRIDVTHSPDDSGFYAEIVDGKSGRTIFITEVTDSKYATWRVAYTWIEHQKARKAEIAEIAEMCRSVSDEVLADVTHQINSKALATALKHEREKEGEQPEIFDALVRLRDLVNQRVGRR